MNLFIKMLKPVIIIFIGLTILIFSGDTIWQKFNVDKFVLLGANLLFFIVSLTVFFIQKNALLNTNPNVFVRSIIAGMMIKMFSTVLAILAYIIITGKDYNTRAIVLSLFMYLIYLGAEVFAISKENNKKNV